MTAQRAAAYSCPYSWCRSDHTNPHDFADDYGSRFHEGSEVEFTTSSDETWSGVNFSVQPTRYDDAGRGTSDTRLRVGDGSVTLAQARALAAWLTAQAENAAALQ